LDANHPPLRKESLNEGQAISVSDTVVKNPMTSHERRKEQHINIHDKKHCSNFLFLKGDGWHPIVNNGKL
jgi:hypothetical protein